MDIRQTTGCEQQTLCTGPLINLSDPLIKESSAYLSGRIRIGIIGGKEWVFEHIYRLRKSPFLSFIELKKKELDGTSGNKKLTNLHCLVTLVSTSKDLQLLQAIQRFPYKVVLVEDEMLHEAVLLVSSCRIRSIFNHNSVVEHTDAMYSEIIKTAVVGFLLKGNYSVREDVFFALADRGFRCINDWLKGIGVTRRRLEQLNRQNTSLSPSQTLTFCNALLYALRTTIRDGTPLDADQGKLDQGRQSLYWIVQNWKEIYGKVFSCPNKAEP